jgi:hypothetical protein
MSNGTPIWYALDELEADVKSLVLHFLMIFALTFVVSAVVSYLYALVAHGTGTVDWGMPLRLGIILGVILPLIVRRQSRT